MRRITLFFTLALAAILALPGLVGQLARSRHEALVGALAASIEGARVSSSVFEPGWFTSRAIHQIAFDGPGSPALAEEPADVGATRPPPTLIVDSRLAHGPWSGDGPALMSIRSELALMGSNGEVTNIPGEVLTRIGLTGNGESRFLSPGPSGDLRMGARRASWEAADVRVAFADDARELASEGSVGRLVLAGPAGELVLGGISLRAHSRRSEFGFWIGASDAGIERAEVIGPDGGVISGAGLRLNGEIAEADALVDFGLRLEAAAIDGGAVGQATVTAALSGARIDAEQWGRYLEIRRTRERGAGVDFARLSRSGPRFVLEELDIVSRDGALSATADLTLPADSRPRGPLTALGSAEGEGALSVSPRLLAGLAQSGEGLRQVVELLLALGYLREDNGLYVGEFRLRRGLITVNGMPFVLPR